MIHIKIYEQQWIECQKPATPVIELMDKVLFGDKDKVKTASGMWSVLAQFAAQCSTLIAPTTGSLNRVPESGAFSLRSPALVHGPQHLDLTSLTSWRCHIPRLTSRY